MANETKENQMTLTHFHNKFGDDIIRIMKSCGLSYDDAQDARQILYQRMIEQNTEIRDDASHRFVFVISKNQAQSYYDVEQNRKLKEIDIVYDMNLESEMYLVDFFETELKLSSKTKMLYKKVIKLSEAYYPWPNLCMLDILNHRVDGLTYEEIGIKFGISGSQISNAVKKWKDKLSV
ncbi:MAG: hypothetical protein QQN41_06135 [Nitrosopumilus sp.]